MTGVPTLVARLRVRNGGGVFDSWSSTGVQPRIAWSVSKSLASSPNTAKIMIYGLSAETVAKVQGVVRTRIEWTPAEREQLLAAGANADPVEIIADQVGSAAIELAWGYADSERLDEAAEALRVGFVGHSTLIRPTSDRRALEIEAEDGSMLLGAGQVLQRAGSGYRAKSYAPGVELVDVLLDLVNACGLSTSRGRLLEVLSSAMLSRGLPLGDLTLSSGFVAEGSAAVHVERFLTALQLRWSVQDGELLILGPGGTIPGVPSLVLSRDRRNILGQPQQLEGERMRVATLALTDATPGRRVEVNTPDLAAAYVLEAVSVDGDTDTGGTASLELDKIQTIAGVF